MKKELQSLIVYFLFPFTLCLAQEPRVSPSASVSKKAGNVDIKIDYSQPSVKGRKVWGGLVPYDQVWRTGANEATTIEFSNDVKINGKALSAGKYSLFTIPGKDSWVIIFNKTADQWGSFKYNKDLDALRVSVKAKSSSAMTEKMTFDISENGIVGLQWEKQRVQFQVWQAGLD
jgi:Protein of unknown function (DUF2911)